MAEINQQVIADRLGISRATISRCFTNHAGISPLTRAKVFQVAAELGYTHMETRTTSGERSKKKKNTFCVLICSDSDEYFRGSYQSPGEQILAGVTEHAQMLGARVNVHLIPPNAQSLDDPAFKRIENFNPRQTNGLILIYPFSSAVLDELALRFPLVSLVDQFEHDSLDCVDVDQYHGISRLIDHLIAAGHKKIGFYTRSYPVEAGWSFRRYAAFIEKMARMKLPVAQKDVIGMFPRPSASLEESLDQAFDRTNKGVTAWVCAADHQAYDLIHGLEERGLTVPKDVSITGFDGIDPQDGQPTLTTLEIPFREIGATGMERLAARLRKRFHESKHIYISGKLLEGETVAPPRG